MEKWCEIVKQKTLVYITRVFIKLHLKNIVNLFEIIYTCLKFKSYYYLSIVNSQY